MVRAAAAWALGRIATDAALAALTRHRDDADEAVRAAVDRACAGEPDPEASPAPIDLDAGGET